MNEKFDSQVLVRASFFVAISIVLTRLGSIKILPSIRFGFGELPLIISGMMLGPFIGGCTGLVADLLGFMIDTTGAPFHPGFTLSSVLWGVIPGIISYMAIKYTGIESINDRRLVLFIVVISRLIVGIGLNSYWLTSILGKGYLVIISERLLTSLVKIPVETFLIDKLVRNLNRVTNYN